MIKDLENHLALSAEQSRNSLSSTAARAIYLLRTIARKLDEEWDTFEIDLDGIRCDGYGASVDCENAADRLERAVANEERGARE